MVLFQTAAINVNNNSTTATVVVSVNQGDAIIAIVSERAVSAISSGSFSDSIGSNYILAVKGVNVGFGQAAIAYTTAPSTTTSNTISLAFANQDKCVFMGVTYSGVFGFGATNTNNGNSTTLPSIIVSTSYTNNWVVGGFASEGTGIFSQQIGTLRESDHTTGGLSNTNVGGAIADSFSSVPGPITIAVSTGTQQSWAAAGIELLSTPTLTQNITVKSLVNRIFSANRILNQNITISSSISIFNGIVFNLLQNIGITSAVGRGASSFNRIVSDGVSTFSNVKKQVSRTVASMIGIRSQTFPPSLSTDYVDLPLIGIAIIGVSEIGTIQVLGYNIGTSSIQGKSFTKAVIVGLQLLTLLSKILSRGLQSFVTIKSSITSLPAKFISLIQSIIVLSSTPIKNFTKPITNSIKSISSLSKQIQKNISSLISIISSFKFPVSNIISLAQSIMANSSLVKTYTKPLSSIFTQASSFIKNFIKIASGTIFISSVFSGGAKVIKLFQSIIIASIGAVPSPVTIIKLIQSINITSLVSVVQTPFQFLHFYFDRLYRIIIEYARTR